MINNNVGNTRSRLVVWNIVGSFFAKGISSIAILAMVPLTLHCLGEYNNGVWLTISSVLVWLDQMDIGLGNGLRNKLAQSIAQGRDQEARSIVSSTVGMLILIIVPITLILSIILWNCDVWAFLNVEPTSIPELRHVLFAMLLLAAGSFVMKFIGNVYMGMQMPSINNILLATGQMLALILTWFLLRTHQATLLNIAIVNTLSPLAVWILSYPVTFYKVFPHLRPSIRLVNIKKALELGNLGLKFFWLQIATIIQFSSSNILISHFFTPELVTPFQVAYRYMSLALMIFSIICMPLWNATTDAYARGDMAWIRGIDKKMNLLILSIAVIMLMMNLVAPFVYGIWINNETHVSAEMTFLMSLYVFLLVVSMRYSYILNGMGALRLQMLMTISTAVYIPLAWFVSSTTQDINCFLAVMCVCNVPGLVVNVIQYKKILNQKATGIWSVK